MAAKDALKKLRDQRTKLLEAAKQKRAEERRLERQQNARRRDLLGGMALELMESGEWPKDRILSRTGPVPETRERPGAVRPAAASAPGLSRSCRNRPSGVIVYA